MGEEHIFAQANGTWLTNWLVIDAGWLIFVDDNMAWGNDLGSYFSLVIHKRTGQQVSIDNQTSICFLVSAVN